MNPYSPLFTAPVATLSVIPTSAPEYVADESLLHRTDQEITARFPKMRSCLVAKDGKVIWERYYHGHTASSLNDLRSATKSFTSTLMGIAMSRGEAPRLDDCIRPYLNRYTPRREDPLLEQITVRHLLTMTSGFYWHTGKKLGELLIRRLHRSRSWASFALRLPIQEEMLGTFQYRSVDSHLLSVLLSECCGMDAYTYAQEHLFGPLGIERSGWAQDPDGHSIGHVGLYLTSRDMTKFGMCCLNEGMWNEQRIIPAEWLNQAMQAHTEGYPAFGHYGFQWWTGRMQQMDYACAHGHGGQQIYVIPGLKAVVTFTADSRVSRWKNPRSLLERFILPALSAGGTP